MKKHTFVGITSTGKACKLDSAYDFNQLKENTDQIERQDFIHDSSNWSGCDDVDRALKIFKVKMTSDHIHLNTPIEISGCDYDCGHSYPWSITITDIYNTEEVE